MSREEHPGSPMVPSPGRGPAAPGLPAAEAADVDELLAWWFGGVDGPEAIDSAQFQLWFKADPAVDAHLRERWGARHAEALAGRLDGWAATPRGRLALVLLLDQFSRNIHRGTALAFAGDARAQALVGEALAADEVKGLWRIEQAMLLMPLMHAEDRALAAQSVAAFTELSQGAPADFPNFGEFAQGHADIVTKFGRYPYRNNVLGRETTEAEAAWLAADAPTFGQGG